MTEKNSTESELIESVTDADSNIRLREAFELFDAALVLNNPQRSL